MKKLIFPLLFIFALNMNAQSVKKKHLKTLARKAELIQLSPIDKNEKIYIGDITTNKGRDKARMKEEFMKYFGLNGFKLTTNKEEAGVIIEGGYSHDLIAPGQILGFDITITNKEGLLIATFSKRSNSFVGPTFDSAIAVYLIDNLRLVD
tara:strand:- start:76 stop:525 length:450 start_codon:yes stop_codon:yes gene_type:complete